MTALVRSFVCLMALNLMGFANALELGGTTWKTGDRQLVLSKDGTFTADYPGTTRNGITRITGLWTQEGSVLILNFQKATGTEGESPQSDVVTFDATATGLSERGGFLGRLWFGLSEMKNVTIQPDVARPKMADNSINKEKDAAKPDDSEPSANPTPGSERVKIDRKGLVEEAILDPAYRAQVEAELEAAQKKWLSDERGKEDNFEKVRKEQIDAWRASLSGGHASFDDHPDVMAIKALTGQQGVLIAPTVARKYDNMLIDRGWYPYADKADDDTEEHLRSFRERYTPQNEIKIPTDIKIDALGISDPDIPVGIDIPSYKAIRDHYLKTEVK